MRGKSEQAHEALAANPSNHFQINRNTSSEPDCYTTARVLLCRALFTRFVVEASVFSCGYFSSMCFQSDEGCSALMSADSFKKDKMTMILVTYFELMLSIRVLYHLFHNER